MVDGTIQDDVNMQSEVEISHKVKSVESDGDVIVISEKFLRVRKIALMRQARKTSKEKEVS